MKFVIRMIHKHTHTHTHTHVQPVFLRPSHVSVSQQRIRHEDVCYVLLCVRLRGENISVSCVQGVFVHM